MADKKKNNLIAAPREEQVDVTKTDRSINILAPKIGGKEICDRQSEFDLEIEAERDVEGIGMGVLSDGTPYPNQRGLSKLCGVNHTHIGTISSQWNEGAEKPRTRAIKAILEERGLSFATAHVEIIHRGATHYCYPAEVCSAILEYYAFDAGANCRPEARKYFRALSGSKLRDLIYREVGYDPTGAHRTTAQVA